jgi:uncharacterized protein
MSAARIRVIYLHGFRSSPQSYKARLFGEALAQAASDAREPPAIEFVCPQLPASPAQAMRLILDEVQPRAEDVVIGSSLGGYYARYVAEHCGCRTVLLNPSITPALSLARHLGSTRAFHSDAPFEFRAEYLEALQRFAVPRVSHPERCLLVAATGDELLDWRDMVAAWQGAQMMVIEGSDHALSDFADHIGRVLEFAGIAPVHPPSRLQGSPER